MVTAAGQDHLDSLDDGAASCKGDRHDFPKLHAGRRWPKGVTSRRVRHGVFQLTYRCPDCGTVRTKTTAPGGILATGEGHRYSYKHPRGYLAPPGAGLTKADYARNHGKRIAADIEANAEEVSQPSAAEAKFQAPS